MDALLIWASGHASEIGYATLGLVLLIAAYLVARAIQGWLGNRNRRPSSIDVWFPIEKEVKFEFNEDEPFIQWSEDRESVVNGNMNLEDFVDKWSGRVPMKPKKIRGFMEPAKVPVKISISANPDPWVYRVNNKALIKFKGGQWVRNRDSKKLGKVEAFDHGLMFVTGDGYSGWYDPDRFEAALPKIGEWWGNSEGTFRASVDHYFCDGLVPINFGRGHSNG
jgi:hypothetical protein